MLQPLDGLIYEYISIPPVAWRRYGFGIWWNACVKIGHPLTTTPHKLNFANFE